MTQIPLQGTVHMVHPGDDIQSVINSANAGDTIFFTAGTYDVNQTLQLKSGLLLHGEPGATLMSVSSNTMVNGTNISNTSIDGLTFDGGTTGAGGVTGSNAAFLLDASNNVQVVNSTFKNITADAAVFIFDSDNVNISNNVGDHLTQFASAHPNNAVHSNLTIDNNTISNISRFGIEVQGPYQNLHVDNNTLSTVSDINISVVDDDHLGVPVSVSGNHIVGGNVGIEIGDANGTIANNNISNVAFGVSISSTPNTAIISNTFTSVSNPFSEDGGFTGSQFVGVNTIDGSQVTGWAGHPNGSPAPTTPPPTPTPTPTPTPVPTTPSTITVDVSGDQFQGDPQIVLDVNGQQVGGAVNVTALHSQGQFQEITFTAPVAPSAVNEVDVKFINDLFGGIASEDRNIYVDHITVNGHVFNANQGVNTATNGVIPNDAPHGETLDINGALTFDLTKLTPVPQTPPPPPPPTTSTITVDVSGDQFQGDPQIVIDVNGQQVGGPINVTALHSQGQFQLVTVTANVAPSALHEVDVKFINDLFGGTASQDRNIYVDHVVINGQTLNGNQGVNTATNGFIPNDAPHGATLDINGALTFNLTPTVAATAHPTTVAMTSPTWSHDGWSHDGWWHH